MTDKNDPGDVGYVPDEPEAPKEGKKEAQPRKAAKTEGKKTAAQKLQQQLNKQEEIIQLVVQERDEFKDKYLRNLAEIDNFRKRIKKEKDEFQKFILGEFLIELLPVIDNLERALKTSHQPESNEKSIISGVEMIYKQLIDLLKKHGITEIESLNQPFDPKFHQALSKEEKEGISAPVIAEVYQKGYLYHDKLLRPTLVKVAIPEKGSQFESVDPH